MRATPNKTRGINKADMPSSKVNDEQFVAVPFFQMSTNKFKYSLPVTLKHLDPQAEIYYAIVQGEAKPKFIRYEKPFVLTSSARVELYASRNGKQSARIAQQFYKVPSDRSITVLSEVHPMYTAGGKDALIDGIIGDANWKTGDWQSYYAKDFVAIIDLQKVRPVKYVGVHVLQEVSPWIVYPKEVVFEISNDGKTFKPLTTVENKIIAALKEPEVQTLGAEVTATARYIRVRAKTGGQLPAWHESAGSPSHIFIDEVIVK